MNIMNIKIKLMIVLGYGIHRACTLQYDDLSITAGILPCKSEKITKITKTAVNNNVSGSKIDQS